MIGEENVIKKLLFNLFALWGIIAILVLSVIPSLLGCPEPWKSILSDLGISAFILLTISRYIDKTLNTHTNTEIKQLISKQFPMLVEFEKIGLLKTIYNNHMMPNNIDIVNTDSLIIIMNDGKNFITNNSNELCKRFKMPLKQTKLILLNDNSDSEKSLCQRHAKEQNHYKNKINDTIQMVQGYLRNSPPEHKLEIYKYDYNFPLSVVFTSEVAIVGTYRNSTGKFDAPPSYIYSANGTEYLNIKEDIKRLIEDSKKIF
jgi:hypothetical protein